MPNKTIESMLNEYYGGGMGSYLELDNEFDRVWMPENLIEGIGKFGVSMPGCKD